METLVFKEYKINPDRKLVIELAYNHRFVLRDIWDTGDDSGPYEEDIWNFKSLEEAIKVAEILLNNL